jgi:phosphoglycolate phosphatase
MNKLVIFDLDGTLLNSIDDIADNINIMLKKFGYPERSVKEIMQFVGNGARKIVERSLPNAVSEDKLNECLSFYNDLYTNCGSPKTRLYDGMSEVLLSLKEKGYKLAILTNKPQETTDEVYKKYLAEYNFDVVVGQRANKKTKPDPETTLEIIKNLSADKEKTYFIGDGETDVQTAINAGVNGIAVLWGFRDKTQLQTAGASNFVSSPLELLNVIK